MSGERGHGLGALDVVVVGVHGADRVGEPDDDLLHALLARHPRQPHGAPPGRSTGSANWKRRMPLRTTSRNESRITSSPAGTQEMKRIPVVMKLSGVSGIAALISRIRSHGSSRWKRTDTAMCVLEVKSSAWKPTRSIVGAMARMSGVVSPVALQRLWLPSRVVVSTMSTSSLTARPGTASRRTRPPARSRRGSRRSCPTRPRAPSSSSSSPR